MDFMEETLSKKQIYEGKIITVETHQIKLMDGQEGFREIVHHPGGVCILARDENQRILMVRQYRKPMEEAYLELPAGKLEPDLTPMENAFKELEEETGYKAESLKELGAYATSPGYSDELIHLFVAGELSLGVKGGDDDEFIDIIRLTDEEFIHGIKVGTIKDLKTVACYTLSLSL